MEAKREEHVEAFEALVVGAELGLGEAEGVAQVEAAVHVRVRESHHELGLRAPVLVVQRLALRRG